MLVALLMVKLFFTVSFQKTLAFNLTKVYTEGTEFLRNFNKDTFHEMYSFYIEGSRHVRIVCLLQQNTEERSKFVDAVTDYILNALYTSEKTLKNKTTFTIVRLKLHRSFGRPSKETDTVYEVTPNHTNLDNILISSGIKSSTAEQMKNFKKYRQLSVDVNKSHLILVWDDFVLNRFLDERGVNRDIARGTFVILFLSHNHQEDGAVCEQWTVNAYGILRRLWQQFGILNAVIAAPCSCDHSGAFIYKPFFRHVPLRAPKRHQDNGGSADDDGELIERWGKMIKFNVHHAKVDPYLYTNNMNDLNGYPLRVVMFPRTPTAVVDLPRPMIGDYINKELNKSSGYAGMDGRLLIALSQSMNFKANVSNTADLTEFGYKSNNGTFFGSLGDIVYRRVDISFNGRYVKDYGTKDIEFLLPVSNDPVCILTPKAQRIPQWIMIFQCFNASSWAAIVLTVLVAGSFSYVLQCRSHHPDDNRSVNEYSKTLLNVFGLFISLQVTLANSQSHRLFLASCLIFNVIIAGTFQGNLITSYTTDSYYKDINTLKQLDGSGLKIGTGSNNLRDIFSNETGLLRSLADKLVILNESTIDRAAVDRDIAAIERKVDANMFIKTKFINPDGSEMLHLVTECPRAYFISYIVPNGSPYLYRFNAELLRFFEAGFFAKWYNHITDAYIIESRAKYRSERNYQKALNLYDVQTAFYVLMLGYFAAIALFLVEIFLGRRYRRKNYLT